MVVGDVLGGYTAYEIDEASRERWVLELPRVRGSVEPVKAVTGPRAVAVSGTLARGYGGDRRTHFSFGNGKMFPLMHGMFAV